MNSIRLSWFSVCAAALVGSGCQGAPSPDPGAGTSLGDPAPSRTGPEEVLGGPAAPGFQPTGDAFVARTDTHEATVRAGSLVVVPHHFDGSRSIEGAPLTFATDSIRRGDEQLATGRAATRLQEGMVAVDRDGAIELFENRDDGIEQSWRFAGEPAGDGDLLVEVAVSGHQTVESSRTGLHFLSGDRLGASYSHATWVDASGISWNIPVAWNGQRIAMRVPSSVLDRSAWPAALDPIIGPERTMDTPVDGFTGGSASDSQLAGSGGNILAVWTDRRNGNEREAEVYATRMTGNADPIGQRGIAVAHTTLDEHEPTVVWTGSEWLMAFTREDATGAGIRAARVSTLGVVTDLGIVANTAAFESEPQLASDGAGGALMVFQWNQNIRVMRYANGAFGNTLVITSTAGTEAHPTVACSGSNYLVAWENGDSPGQDVYGRLVPLAGTPPPAFIVSDATQGLSQVAAAYDGTDYLLLWRRAGDIWGSRVSTAGAVLDSTSGVGGIVVAATPNRQVDPSIACTTTQCLLAWGDERDTTDPDDAAYDLVAQRLDFNLAPVGGEITVGSLLRNQDEPSVTTTSNGSFVVSWSDARNGSPNLFATRITPDGAVQTPDGKLINVAAKNAQNRGSYAVGTTTQLAVWSDSRTFGDDIRARRHASNGARIDDDSLVVSDAAFDQLAPSVAFDGSQYVVAWRDDRGTNADIFTARMQEDGTVSDPAGVAVATAADQQIAPDVASGGGVSLVAWQDRRDASTNGYDLFGAILLNGTVLVPDIPICQTTDEQVNARVIFDPNSSLFVVAWSDRRNAGSSDVYAARVDTAGTVLDPCGVPISEATNWQQLPSLAVSGSQILVVWEDYRTDFFGDIWGGRITVDATAITRLDGDGVPIAEGVSWQTTPTTVGVGSGRWGIAWTDTLDELTTGTDIRGNTMAADGTLSIEPEYVISNGVYFESAPRFQSGGGTSKVSLMYEYDNPSLGVLRVKRRIITY